MALLNFSLALFIGVMVVPVALLAAGRHSALARIPTAGLTLLVSPPLLFLYGIALNLFVHEGAVDVFKMLTVSA